MDESVNITENKPGFISGIYEKAKPYWLYIIISIIIIAVLIFIFSSKDEEEDFEEEDFIEEDEEEKKPLKLWRWIIGIIAIAGIAYAQIKYDLFSYVKEYAVIAYDYAEIYKFYILVGLILILIIVLIVKYWSSIIDFFEEEDETPKKRRKRK